MKEDDHIIKLISISFDKVVFSGNLEMEQTIETNLFKMKKISQSQIMIIDEMEKHVVLMNEIFSINHNHYVFVTQRKRFQILAARFDLPEQEIFFQNKFFPFLKCILNNLTKINSKIFLKCSLFSFELLLFIFLINLFFINKIDAQSEDNKEYDFSSYIQYMQSNFKEEKVKKVEKNNDDKDKKEVEIIKIKTDVSIKNEKKNEKVISNKKKSKKEFTEKDEEFEYFIKMISGRRK